MNYRAQLSQGGLISGGILSGMSVFGSSTLAHFSRSMFGLNLRDELKELYLFSLLFSFAYSLVIIFEPVFFYQTGFSLSFIALYYAMHYILYIFLLPLGGMFAARFGFERSISLSLPLFVLYFLSLTIVPDHNWMVFVAVVLLTLHKTFY